MSLEYKSIPFELKEMADVSGGGWEIAGYASVWGGPPDAYNDIVVRGAFADSLATRQTKFLFEHREAIGKPIDLREDDYGLFGRWAIVDTTSGTDAYKLAKAGAVDGLSIGYVPVDVEYQDGVRLLKSVDLFEVSLVAIPALDRAVITDVKADELKATWSSGYVSSLPDASFALILPGGTKDSEGKTTPRSLRKLPHHSADMSLDLPHLNNALSRAPQMTGVSDAQRARAVSHLQKHKDAASKALELASKHEPDEPPIRIGDELRRRRLARHGIDLMESTS